MAEPFIRPICEEDVKQIHEIEKACFAMPWSEESILHDVKENVVARWLVLDDGNGGVLAYAGMWFVLDEAHVCNVAVRPDSRGLGYGKRIFTALIDLAMENSMAMITLEVRRSNTIAQNLYHACGMLDVGYRKRYYEDNKEDALIMYRDFVYPEAGENEAGRGLNRKNSIQFGGGSAVNRRCPLFFWRKMEYNIKIRNNGDD